MRYLKQHSENTFIFIAFLILYVAFAYFFTVILDTHYNDTVSRTALGYIVIYGRYPKLANVGFVWTPLLSLLQLPLFPLLRLVRHQDLAGPIITAISGAATIPILNSIGKDLNVNKRIRWITVLLFGLNPTIVLYSAVGMSEIFFFLPFALCILYLEKWLTGKRQYTALAVSGSALAVAFWSRYEAIPILFAVCIIILLYILEHPPSSISVYRLSEAGIITFALPTIYSVVLWIFFNRAIMGDPWYWMTGEYSNTMYTSLYETQINLLKYDLLASIIYATKRIVSISPLLIFILFVAIILSLQKKSWMPILILIPSFAIISFHILQTFLGVSYGWYRFYSYGIIGSVWGFFWLWHFLSDKKKYRVVFEIISIALMIFAYFSTTYAMLNPTIGKEENNLISVLISSQPVTADESGSYAVAKSVNQFIIENNKDNGLILIDFFRGFAIILAADDPDIFVKTQDKDFKKALKEPIEFGIEWILVPKLEKPLQQNEWMYRMYPGIWEDPPSWLVMVKDFGAWRIYKVAPREI